MCRYHLRLLSWFMLVYLVYWRTEREILKENEIKLGIGIGIVMSALGRWVGLRGRRGEGGGGGGG